MPQLVRHYCSRCQQSIYNCIIDGVRVPMTIYLVAGQPDDTGDTLDLNADGVKVPSFIRALMSLPTARVELCVRCLAEVFALPLLAAGEDPMGTLDENGNGIPDLLEQSKNLGKVQQAAAITAPVFDAIRAGHTKAFEVGARAALAAAGVVDEATVTAALTQALGAATTAITVGGPTSPVGDGPTAAAPTPTLDQAPASTSSQVPNAGPGGAT